MSDLATLDQRLDDIQAANVPILAQFKTWLEQSGVTPKTTKNHIDNISFFATFLVYYDTPDRTDTKRISWNHMAPLKVKGHV